MYYRFLNNNDYIDSMSAQAFSQLIRDRDAESLCSSAEMLAESLVRDYLTTHYDIDYELDVGKYIAGYSPDINITFPAGEHIYIDGRIYQTLTSVMGAKKPLNNEYWERLSYHDIPKHINVQDYSQMETYKSGDIVSYNDKIYKVLIPNGFGLFDIRIPDLEGWVEVEFSVFLSNTDYDVRDVVQHDGEFYFLKNEDFDKLKTPDSNPTDWGKIESYSYEEVYRVADYAKYIKHNGDEVVVTAVTNVNKDDIIIGGNVIEHDPRNITLKKHMLRIAIYELSKQISPNNTPSVWVDDYRDTCVWLNRAGSLKITPDIKRKRNKSGSKTTGWAVAKFERGHDGKVLKTGWSAW